MFCKEKIAKHFSLAANHYNVHALFQSQVAQDLQQLIQKEWVAGAVSDLGAGTGFVCKSLKENFPNVNVISLDIAFGMIRLLKQKSPEVLGICADAEELPFAGNSFSLITTSLMLQWSTNLEKMLGEMHRVLQKEGRVVFSTLGENSLHELKASWCGTTQPVHEFLTKEKLLAQLQSYFDVQTIFEKNYVLHYPNALDVLRSLQDTGVNNSVKHRGIGLSGKNVLKNTIINYEKLRSSAGVPLTYQVYFGVLRK